ncbi:MAG: glutamate--tRNA ligase [Candidatus Marinamargulisbacteria bacterium]
MTVKRLRFAPSPTGNLHIGSVRTAIFNWIWAKSLNAELVLRIEDTDAERSHRKYEDNIMAGLDWLGITFDEGPHQPKKGQTYRQSERMADHAYGASIQTLLDNGSAYYCFETDAELDKEREQADNAGQPYMYSRKSLQYTPAEVQEKLAQNHPYTIRFKVPQDQTIIIDDVVRQRIEFDASLISDFIILKSDGCPTYNFAVVVDDHDMGITHVVRGEDHISNTPKQQMIYNALGWDVPIFAHLPIILGTDRSKLSKRHGATSVMDYQKDGFLPHVLVNYLSLLGWSPPEGKEILSLDELIALFDVSRINKAGAVFDVVKLTWMNKQYLSKLTDAEFLSQVAPYLTEPNRTMTKSSEKIISVRDNVEFLSQINDHLVIYSLTLEQFLERFHQLPFKKIERDVLTEIEHRLLARKIAWTWDDLENLVTTVSDVMSIKKGVVMKALRKGITGFESGPNLFECMLLIPHIQWVGRLESIMYGTRHQVID